MDLSHDEEGIEVAPVVFASNIDEKMANSVSDVSPIHYQIPVHYGAEEQNDDVTTGANLGRNDGNTEMFVPPAEETESEVGLEQVSSIYPRKFTSHELPENSTRVLLRTQSWSLSTRTSHVHKTNSTPVLEQLSLLRFLTSIQKTTWCLWIFTSPPTHSVRNSE